MIEDKPFILWCHPGQEVRITQPISVCPACGFEATMPIRIQTKDGWYMPCLSCLADLLINLGIPEMKQKKETK
jgi:hypothetical protein